MADCLEVRDCDLAHAWLRALSARASAAISGVLACVLARGVHADTYASMHACTNEGMQVTINALKRDHL
eukprot:3385792-Pleurochrysis_carterae.AAC.2